MKTDTLFYRLFQAIPECYFELIGAQAATAANYTFASEELKHAGLRVDGVFLPAQAGQPVHFVEVFFYKTAHAYSNLFAKVFLWLEAKDPAQDWHATIIFANRQLEPDEQHPYRALLASDQVTRIYLDELPPPAEHQLGLGIMELITTPMEETIAKAKMWLERSRRLLRTVAERHKAIELIEKVVVSHLPNLSREELERMLHLTDYRESKIYQEALQEGREEMREEMREDFAVRLLAKKYPITDIVELTGLSVQRVRQLKKKLLKP